MAGSDRCHGPVSLVPVFIAVAELGDPPYTANDWMEDFLLAGWLLLFLAAILTARATHDGPTFAGIITFSIVLTVLGLFFII